MVVLTGIRRKIGLKSSQPRETLGTLYLLYGFGDCLGNKFSPAFRLQ